MRRRAAKTGVLASRLQKRTSLDEVASNKSLQIKGSSKGNQARKPIHPKNKKVLRARPARIPVNKIKANRKAPRRAASRRRTSKAKGRARIPARAKDNKHKASKDKASKDKASKDNKRKIQARLTLRDSQIRTSRIRANRIRANRIRARVRVKATGKVPTLSLSSPVNNRVNKRLPAATRARQASVREGPDAEELCAICLTRKVARRAALKGVATTPRPDR